MRITILGSGVGVPSLRRRAASLLLEFGPIRLLLDIGPGVLGRLTEAGRLIFDITHIGLTHFHPDHTAELASFLFATKYPDVSRRQTPLTLLGADGLGQFWGRLDDLYGHWVRLPEPLFQIRELQPTQSLALPGGRLSVAPMAHNPESLAYRIDADTGCSVVVSGDTEPNPELVRLAQGVDMLICECSVPDETPVKGHMTPSLAGQTAAQAGVRHLVLTHFYPPCDETDIGSQCRKRYDGKLTLAQDLQIFHLTHK